MTAADLRRQLEELGVLFSLAPHRQLGVQMPVGGIPAELEAELQRRRRALYAHLTLYPCRGCGTDPMTLPEKCRRCSLAAIRRTPKRSRQGPRVSPTTADAGIRRRGAR